MASKKRLEDLEISLLEHKSDNITDNTNNRGCLMVLAVVLVVIVVTVCIAGARQVGKSNTVVSCAEPGCSNRHKPGSIYCWLHGPGGSSGKTHSSGSSSSSSSGGGSIFGSSSSGSKDSGKEDRGKIWNGKGNEKSSDTSSSSSSSSSGGSNMK